MRCKLAAIQDTECDHRAQHQCHRSKKPRQRSKGEIGGAKTAVEASGGGHADLGRLTGPRIGVWVFRIVWNRGHQNGAIPKKAMCPDVFQKALASSRTTTSILISQTIAGALPMARSVATPANRSVLPNRARPPRWQSSWSRRKRCCLAAWQPRPAHRTSVADASPSRASSRGGSHPSQGRRTASVVTGVRSSIRSTATHPAILQWQHNPEGKIGRHVRSEVMARQYDRTSELARVVNW